MLSKYVVSDGKAPKINKLNDGRFQKTKQKVQTQVEDIADDLIKLYAERSQLEGLLILKMMKIKRLLNKIFHILKQMINYVPLKKSKKIWNRIVQWTDCWLETWFGKTEVAMRAAFKAVNDHKQVAVWFLPLFLPNNIMPILRSF